MIYLQRSRDKEDKKFRRSIYVGILFICIAVYFTFYGFHPLRSAALYIASPFWRMSSGIGNYIESGAGYFISKESLRAENMALKKEVFSANLKLLSENALLEENVKLKALLGREDKEKSFMATVLARPPITLYDTLVIDVGQEEGVKQGDLITAESVVLGYLADVFTHTSIVKLYSSPNEKTVIAIGDKKIQADAYGLGGGVFRTAVQKDIEVKKGDSVIMPGINPKIFGFVEDVQSNPSDAIQAILFRNPVNVYELEYVLVIPKQK
jgi:rod shape-determining protein MreC